MLYRLLLSLIVFCGESFSSDTVLSTAGSQKKSQQILLVGFVPGEGMSCYDDMQVQPMRPIPGRFQFTQMDNVHTLDRWVSGEVFGEKISHACVHHKVDWLNKEQWDDFVASNKSKFDLIIFDQRVAHHFSGIENFSETLEGKISNAQADIHTNFGDLLAPGADIYIPICEYPSHANQKIDATEFENYCLRIKNHFIVGGLSLEKIYDRSILDLSGEYLENDPKILIFREFLGNHPLIKIQLQRPEIVIFLWHFKAA